MDPVKDSMKGRERSNVPKDSHSKKRSIEVITPADNDADDTGLRAEYQARNVVNHP